MSRKPNRHYLLCPVCMKTKETLSVHLRRVCMKNSTPEAIDAAVEKAKREVHELLVSGRVFSHVLLRQILDDADPLSRLLEELQHRHMMVTGVPPPLPNAESRRVFEMTLPLTDADKSLMANYLTLSTATAEKHYRMKQTDSAELARLAGDSSAVSAEEGTSGGAGRTRGTARVVGNVQMDVQAAYDKLLENHPVTLDGDVPSKSECEGASPDCQQALYERWLKAQMKLRKQHVLAYFCHRLPTENRVSAWIAKQGWKSNIPTAANIIKEWKPSGSEDTAMDSNQIQKLMRSQKWRGLLVSAVEEKRKGVIATRRFQTGEVVCDYHGRVITAKEAEHIHENISEEETRYMFFYRDKRGQPMCINAHSEFCECHPGRQTVGRLINRSRAAANLRPRLYTVVTDGEEKDIILFLATRNIDVNEELYSYYKTSKKSFCGKGSNLAWLP